MISGSYSFLNLHDDSPRPAMRAEKFAFVKGVGYMSRKRQIDRRFLHGRLHCDSIFLQINISPIFSNTNSAIAVTQCAFFDSRNHDCCLISSHYDESSPNGKKMSVGRSSGRNLQILTAFAGDKENSLFRSSTTYIVHRTPHGRQILCICYCR